MRAARWLAVCTWLAAPCTSRAASQDFTLVNRTGYPIQSIHVTEAGHADWGNDVMGRDTLAPGERLAVSFDRGTRQCRWDLMVEYRDRTQAVWSGLNLCDTTRIAILWNPISGQTVAVSE